MNDDKQRRRGGAHCWAALTALTLASACALGGVDELGDDDEGEFHGELDLEAPYFDELADSSGNVYQQLSRCTTAGVLGLAEQIADEMRCMSPGELVRLDEGGGIVFRGSAVMPYFTAEAADDLQAVAAKKTLYINSGFRTVAQQYMLYKWMRLGKCGIKVAARPGNSNHESGRAVDVHNYSSVLKAMKANNWAHPLKNDKVHFEHTDSDDLRGIDVEAFQRLWNRNNPDDPVPEDGVYDDDLANKLARAPAVGFPVGVQCSLP